MQMQMPVSGWSAVTVICASLCLAYALDITAHVHRRQIYAHVTQNVSWLMLLLVCIAW